MYTKQTGDSFLPVLCIFKLKRVSMNALLFIAGILYVDLRYSLDQMLS